jgi:hypothetical protein
MYKNFIVYDNDNCLIANVIETSGNLSNVLNNIFSIPLELAPVQSLGFKAIFSGKMYVGRVEEKEVAFYLYNLTKCRYFRNYTGFATWDVTDWHDATKFNDKDVLDEIASTLNTVLEDTYIVEAH